MWHVDAEIISLIFMLVLMVDIFKTNQTKSLRNKLFNTLTIATVLAILSDIVSSYAMINYQTGSWWFVQGSLLVYFILTPLLSMLWLLYTITVVKNTSKSQNILLIITAIPFVIFMAVVILNPYTGWIFKLSATNEYTRGVLFDSLFLIFYGYSIATLLIACSKFKRTERATSIVLMVFPFIAGFGILLQQLLPGYLVTGAAFSLVILITYMFLQNKKATRDNLTETFNRVAFTAVVDRISGGNRQGAVLAVAIDDFKLFNQTFGQKNGDRLLQKIAEYMVSISPDKICYRYSGDIFALILKRSNENESLKLANEIMNHFAKSFYVDTVGYSISVSIGIVEYPRSSEDKNHSIITALDFSIYQAKKCGKGQIAFFNEDLVMQFKRRHAIAAAIANAMKNQSFEVHVQPIYHLNEQKFLFAEALLRLYDEKLGWVSPAEFIPIAEATGQIVDITYFVLEQVCAFIKRNRNALKDEISVSVNFSVIQFMQTDLVERVKGIIGSYNIPPRLIKIEITESVIADSFDDIKSGMQQLHAYGIRFALDDYGQGYSNISYLLNLPFSVVKLDKSIIDNVVVEPNFISAMISMFKSLNKSVVAEGVETEEQANLLRDLSCDSIQGYYFAKPMPMNETIELFDRR